MTTKTEEIITLGKLIDLLELRPKDESVIFDFCGLMPTHLSSYRGYYDQLALGWKEYVEPGQMTVAKLLKDCVEAVGETFEGWKGGSYTMHVGTHVWVANPGESHATAITGIADCEYWTIITTAFYEGY